MDYECCICKFRGSREGVGGGGGKWGAVVG